MKKIKELGIKIDYNPLEGSLGYWDTSTGTVVISTKQKKYEQDIILIHEFLHATASGLVQLGVIKKLPDHKFISNCSTQLLALFVLSGKWKGLTKKDIKNILPSPSAD